MNLFLRLVLSLSLVLAAPLQTMAQTPQYKPVISDAEMQRTLTKYSEQIYSENPLLEEFVKDDPLPENLMDTYSPNDPVLDQDPYFLRSQSWQPASTQEQQMAQHNDGLITFNDDEMVSLYSRGWTHKLIINTEVYAVLEGSEFIYFTAKSNEMFAQKIGSKTEAAQGIFYVSREELYRAAHQNNMGGAAVSTRTPLYFLPLPEKGWTGNLVNMDMPDTDSVVFYNSINGFPLAIQKQDIRDHHKVMQRNMSLVKAQWQLGLKSTRKLTIEEIMYPVAAKGSTASFGNFMTGIDLENHQSSFWAKTNMQKFEQHMDELSETVLPKAYADANSLITPDVLEKLIFIGSLIGSAFIASFVVKYAFYFDKFKQRHINRKITKAQKAQLEKDLQQARIDGDYETKRRQIYKKAYGADFEIDNLSLGRDVKEAFGNLNFPLMGRIASNEIKGHFDTYASMLTTIAMGISMSTINILDFMLDRFGKNGLFRAKNGHVRWFFDKTFGYARSTMEKLPVNAKTWWLGAIVMGVVDTGLVVVQLLWVVPLILTALGAAPAVTAGATSATALVVTSEIIRNMVGYFNAGAYSYSADQKMIELDPVSYAVDNELKRNGKNPKDPRVKALRDKMIDARVDEAMKLRGLPGSDQFLFDAESLTKMFTRKGLGYGTDALGVPADKRNEFAMNNGRWGLAKPSINRAIQTAKKIEKGLGGRGNASRMSSEVVSILSEIKGRHNQLMAVPKEALTALKDDLLLRPGSRYHLREVKETRQLMTLLSFGGDLKEILEYLPDWYLNLKDKNGDSYSKDSLIAAARLYKDSFFSLSEGDKNLVYMGPKSRIRIYEAVDTEDILHTNNENYKTRLSELGGTELLHQVRAIATAAGNDAFSREFAKSRISQLIAKSIDNQAEIESYEPVRGDMMARWQRKNARKTAQAEFEQTLARQGPVMTLNTDDYRSQMYNKIYARHYAKRVGVHVSETSPFVTKIHELAEEATQQALETDTERSYINSLQSEVLKKDHIARLYADSFLEAYLQKSLKSDRDLHYGSPEQPGRFQGLRRLLRSDDHVVLDPDAELKEEDVTMIDRLMFLNPLAWQRGFAGKTYRVVARNLVRLATEPIQYSKDLAYGTIRVVESMWFDDAFKPGMYAFINRLLPFVGDATSAFAKTIKTKPLSISFGYLIGYHIWQVQYPYPVWLLFGALGFTGLMMVQVNNRLNKNFGVKPMGGAWEKAKYSFIHSWLTFPVFIPIMLYAEPLTHWWNANVIPLLNSAFQVAYSTSGDGLAIITKLLGGVLDTVTGKSSEASAALFNTANAVALKTGEVAGTCKAVLGGM